MVEEEILMYVGVKEVKPFSPADHRYRPPLSSLDVRLKK